MALLSASGAKSDAPLYRQARLEAYPDSGFGDDALPDMDVNSPRAVAACLLLLALSGIEAACAADSAAIALETKIPLGEIHGRIDHMAVDVKSRRLYVAELGNDSVGVVDLTERKTIRTLKGLREPQGIAYLAATDTLYVSNAGDGSLELLQGADLTPVEQIALHDADNIRADEATGRLYIGYGSGALAVIDATTRTRVSDVALKAHPEGFQLEGSGRQVFINVPDAHEIAVVDRATNKQIAAWPTGDLRGNFPLAVDEVQHIVLAAFRRPAKLAAFDQRDGHLLTAVETCGDSDDVIVDSIRHRVYVICGEGFIDVFAQQANDYRRIAHEATVVGARTALFVPVIDRLLLAVRETATSPAAIWVFRPAP